LREVGLRICPPYRRDVNLVFQQYALFPHMTVRENIEFGLRMKKIAPAERARRIEDVMRLTQIEELRDRYPHQLSGGQQQRVAIARAIVNEPKVLLLDEPLSALDFQLRKELRAELKQLQHRLGMTFVYVTHDQEEAMAMSDRIAVMNDGVVEQIGTPDDIYHRPGSLFVATFVGESNIIRAGGRCRAVRPEKVRLFPGETLNGSARCRGTIEDVAFMGSLYRIRICAQPEGSRLTVYQYGDEGRKWRIGAAVDVEWSPDDEVELNA